MEDHDQVQVSPKDIYQMNLSLMIWNQNKWTNELFKNSWKDYTR